MSIKTPSKPAPAPWVKFRELQVGGFYLSRHTGIVYQVVEFHEPLRTGGPGDVPVLVVGRFKAGVYTASLTLVGSPVPLSAESLANMTRLPD